jgi:hypothetical protein
MMALTSQLSTNILDDVTRSMDDDGNDDEKVDQADSERSNSILSFCDCICITIEVCRSRQNRWWLESILELSNLESKIWLVSILGAKLRSFFGSMAFQFGWGRLAFLYVIVLFWSQYLCHSKINKFVPRSEPPSCFAVVKMPPCHSHQYHLYCYPDPLLTLSQQTPPVVAGATPCRHIYRLWCPMFVCCCQMLWNDTRHEGDPKHS